MEDIISLCTKLISFVVVVVLLMLLCFIFLRNQRRLTFLSRTESKKVKYIVGCIQWILNSIE